MNFSFVLLALALLLGLSMGENAVTTQDEADEIIAASVNTNAGVLNALADAIWKRFGGQEPTVASAVDTPVWSLLPTAPEGRVSRIQCPADISKWAAKLGAVRDLLAHEKQAIILTSYTQMYTAFMEVSEKLYALQSPPKMASYFRVSDAERVLIQTISHSSVLDAHTAARALNSSSVPGGDAMRAFLGNPVQFRFDPAPVRLELAADHGVWPTYTDRAALRRFLEHRAADFCTDEVRQPSEWNKKYFKTTAMDRQRLERSLGAYDAMLGFQGYEQLRHFCRLEEDEEQFLVVTQRTNAVPLSAVYAIQNRTGSSLFTEDGQKWVSIRMRQSLEFLNLMGWVHEMPSGRNIKIDAKNGTPFLLGLEHCRPANETRSRYPEAANIRRFSEVLQVLFLMRNEETPGEWERSFPAGLDLLLKHSEELVAQSNTKENTAPPKASARTPFARATVENME